MAEKELTLDEMEQYAAAIPSAAQKFVPALIARIRALESASQPGGDALATAMHHAAIKYASGDFVDFQHEAREFLLASQPGGGNAGIEDKRALFESMCSPAVLARGKYTQQDYDRAGTQAAWEVFQKAWPVIFAAGQRAAQSAANSEAKGGREES